jgi:hypothetical protein
MNEPKQQVDHKAEALRLLENADELRMGKKPDLRGESLLKAAALVHSNLAIAEGQERVAEQLSFLREEISAARQEGWR